MGVIIITSKGIEHVSKDVPKEVVEATGLVQTSLGELKQQKEQRVTALIAECRMFFAFSNEQFNENKTPLEEGEKYVSLGAGCYMAKGKLKAWVEGTEAIDIWYKDAVKANKLRRANIEYELRNHEAGYTGEIDDTLAALGEGYTREEVRKVLNELEN